jgi:hypothetical protein
LRLRVKRADLPKTGLMGLHASSISYDDLLRINNEPPG